MTGLLHLSDPHFGTERPPVVEALVRWVTEHRPDVLVLSGDITQRAHGQQFRAARAFLDRLKVPASVVIPGNHDIPLFAVWTRIFRPYRCYTAVISPDLEPVLEIPDALIVTVNTTRWYRHVDGEVSSEQVERVAARLARATPSQLRVVVTHQPIAVNRREDDHNLLHGREPAARRWSAAGADLVLGGHIHLPYVAALHEQLPDLARPLWAVQAGTALSRRIRHQADNSFNWVRYEGGGVEGGSGAGASRHALVERWDYVPAVERFELADGKGLGLG